MPFDVITPDWSAPSSVRAFCTTRQGGVSVKPYGSLNLGANSGDDAGAVQQNRQILEKRCPERPHWLKQEHGTTVIAIPEQLPASSVPVADGSVTSQLDTVCTVLTADCVPVLLSDQSGQWVAALHAGWRGLCAGVLEQGVAAYEGRPEHLMAWIGPCIRQPHFQVGPEVREAFMQRGKQAKQAFKPDGDRHFLADLAMLATQRLNGVGVLNITDCGLCTFADARFYSYRRDGRTGRMATVIWRASH